MSRVNTRTDCHSTRSDSDATATPGGSGPGWEPSQPATLWVNTPTRQPQPPAVHHTPFAHDQHERHQHVPGRAHRLQNHPGGPQDDKMMRSHCMLGPTFCAIPFRRPRHHPRGAWLITRRARPLRTAQAATCQVPPPGPHSRRRDTTTAPPNPVRRPHGRLTRRMTCPRLGHVLRPVRRRPSSP